VNLRPATRPTSSPGVAWTHGRIRPACARG
jgi:hypothetical protein